MFIDKLLQKINGISVPNRYGVSIFRQNLKGEDNSSKLIPIVASFPALQFQVKTVTDEGFPKRSIVESFAYETTSMDFLLDDEYTAKKYFDDWMFGNSNGSIFNLSNGTLNYYFDYIAAIRLYQLDTQTLQTIYSGVFKEVYPVSVGEIMLNMDTRGGPYMTIPVTFQFRLFVPDVSPVAFEV